MAGVLRAARGGQVSEWEWVPTTREDYSPMAWRNRVKAAKLKVKIDQRLGKRSEDWVLELAAEPLPELPPPVKRRRRAA